MNPRTMRRIPSNLGTILLAIVLYVLSIVVVFTATIFLIFWSGQQFFTALGYSWLLIEIFASFGLWILSLYRFRRNDVGDRIVNRIRYSLKKYQDQILAEIREVKEILTLAKSDPEKARQIIQDDIDILERNLIADELHKRIQEYDKRLEAFREGALTRDNALILEEQGRTYWLLSLIRDKETRSNIALNAVQKALEFFTFANHPEDYARLKRLLGNVYSTYADVDQKEENCKLAIEAYHNSLEFYLVSEHPLDYLKVMNNIGATFHTVMEIEDSEENYKEAIFAYNKALVVISSDIFPMLYAMILNNIGATYSKFAPLGDEKDVRENCELAIAAFLKALKIRTPTYCQID